MHLYDGILKEKLRRLNQFIPPILTTDEMLQLADQNSQDNDIYTVAELVSGLFCFLNLLELSLFEFQRLLWNHYNCLSLRTQNIQDFLSIIVKNFFFFQRPNFCTRMVYFFTLMTTCTSWIICISSIRHGWLICLLLLWLFLSVIALLKLDILTTNHLSSYSVKIQKCHKILLSR